MEDFEALNDGITIKKEIKIEEIDDEQYFNNDFDDEPMKQEITDIVECFKQEIDYLPKEEETKLDENSPEEEGETYTCSICSKLFRIYDSYTKHMALHTALYQCGICNSKFVFPSELGMHMKAHKGYKCDLCKCQFPSLQKLEQHKLVTCGFHYKCQLCLKDYKSRDNLLTHMKKHYKRGGYLCDKCDILYKSPSELLYHLSSHYKSKCTACEQTTLSVNNRALYVCKECGKTFISVARFNEHTNKHYNNCMYCSKCNIHFKSFKKLKQHVVQHSELKLFKCRMCLEVFKTKTEVREHSLEHTN